jgi:hypothetical protein
MKIKWNKNKRKRIFIYLTMCFWHLVLRTRKYLIFIYDENEIKIVIRFTFFFRSYSHENEIKKILSQIEFFTSSQRSKCFAKISARHGKFTQLMLSELKSLKVKFTRSMTYVTTSVLFMSHVKDVVAVFMIESETQ